MGRQMRSWPTEQLWLKQGFGQHNDFNSSRPFVNCQRNEKLIVSSLDPRSKLIAVFAASCVLITFRRCSELTISLGALFAIVLFLRLGRTWLGLLKGLGFAAFTFFVIAGLAFDLETALLAALRLLTLGTLFFLFFQTTSPEALSNALIKMGLPYPFVFVFTASMQFVYILTRRVINIRDAQRARGIPVEGGLRGLWYLPALAGPLLVQAFQLADELAEAMEARGFGAPGRRFRYEPRLTSFDWAIIALTVVSTVVVIVAR
ncbi:MAG: energy-coupling factor transporter transmembrane component T [Thermodesulfobacteriota bacterium]